VELDWRLDGLVFGLDWEKEELLERKRVFMLLEKTLG
jgi:hypothetical protein